MSRLARGGAVAAEAAAATLVIFALLWPLDPARILSSRFDTDQFAVAMLFFALAFIFASGLASARHRAAAAFNLAGLLLSLATGGMLFAHFGGPGALFMLPTPRAIAIFAALAGLTLYACRVASGRHFVVLIAAALLLGYLAQFAGGGLSASSVSAERYLVYLTFGGEGFLGRALHVISEIVAVFIALGVMFGLIGANRAIERIAVAATRQSRGAAIKVAVLASALLGTVSGSAASNVMTSGAFSIAGMRRLGLSGAQAGGVEAVASTLGQVIPPVMGAAAFLMAEFAGVPFLEVARAAALPSLICIVVLFLGADSMARTLPAPAPDPGDAPPALALRDALYLLPVAGVVTSLALRPDQVALAGVAGAGLAVAAGALRNGVGATLAHLRALPGAAGRPISHLVVAGSALGCIVAALSTTGFDTLITSQIGRLGESSLLWSLLLCALAAIVFGMSMATTGVYIMVAVMLAPGLVELGVPTLAAHFFVLYFGVISMITPPVAFAVLAACGITGAGFYRTGFAAIRFGWVLFLMPFLIVYFPGLLFIGDLGRVLADFAAASGVCLSFSLLFGRLERRLVRRRASGKAPAGCRQTNAKPSPFVT